MCNNRWWPSTTNPETWQTGVLGVLSQINFSPRRQLKCSGSEYQLWFQGISLTRFERTEFQRQSKIASPLTMVLFIISFNSLATSFTGVYRRWYLYTWHWWPVLLLGRCFRAQWAMLLHALWDREAIALYRIVATHLELSFDYWKQFHLSITPFSVV